MNVTKLALVRKGPQEPPPAGGAPHATTDDALLNTQEAARYLRVSVRWLQGNAHIPRVNLALPDAKRATVRYRKRDLDEHVAARVVSPRREEGR